MVRFGGAAGLSSPRVEKHVGSPAKQAHSYPGPHRADVLSIPSAFTCTHGWRAGAGAGAGAGVERGLRRERMEGGWRPDEGMRLSSGLIGGRGGWENAKGSVLQRHKRNTRKCLFYA